MINRNLFPRLFPRWGHFPDWVLFLILYTFSFGLIFFNQGLFWDDWYIFGNKPEVLTSNFKMMGLYWPSYFYNFIVASPFPLFLIRSLAFFCPLLAAMCLNGVLKTIKEIDSLSRIYLILLFLFMPVNSAHIACGMAFYSLCNLLFFFGFWLTKKYFEKRHPAWRICALAAFFISMTTNSILMFYALIIFYIYYREQGRVLTTLKKYPDYIVLPLLFAFIKFTFLVPYGDYQNYNKIDLSALAWIPFNLIAAFYSSFIQPIDESIRLVMANPLLLLAVVYLLYKMINSRRLAFEGQRFSYLRGAMLGVLMIILALLPYLVVNKVPNMKDWDSRHQLLVPLGAAFLIFYGMSYFFQNCNISDKVKNCFFCVLLALFMLFNINICLDFQRDWYKQMSLVHHFSTSSIIQDNNFFLIDDRIPDLNVNDRVLRNYEYTALIRMASHDPNAKFAFNEQNFSEAALREPQQDILTWQFFTFERPQYRVVLNAGTEHLSIPHLLSLIVRERLQPQVFEKSLQNITKVDYEKY